MGLASDWVAVKGRSKAEVLETLGYWDTEEASDEPWKQGACAELPSGWLLVWFASRDMGGADPATLSEGAEALYWAVEEHTMFSTAQGYVDGKEVWSITRDSDKKSEGLEVTGDPPAGFDAILKAAEAKQAEADAEDEGVDYIFDVPSDVVASICGFRYDEDFDNLRFTRIMSTGRRSAGAASGQPRRGFFATLFGKRG